MLLKLGTFSEDVFLNLGALNVAIAEKQDCPRFSAMVMLAGECGELNDEGQICAKSRQRKEKCVMSYNRQISDLNGVTSR